MAQHEDEIRRLPAVGPGVPASDGLVARRAAMRALDTLQIVVPGTESSVVEMDGMPCVEIAAPGADQARGTLLYVHGGGFRLGEAATWTGLASRLSAGSGLPVLIVDYDLAPEHPFPAALTQAVAVYRALREKGGSIFLGGDSAGGGLATSLALHVHHAGLGDPRGLILFSPWLDLTATAASFDRAAGTDAAFSREAALEAASQYLGTTAPEMPLASPLLAPSVAGLPPCWLCASASEVLVDDATRLAVRLVEAGKPVELLIRPGLPHVWPMIAPASAETGQAIDAAARFLTDRIAEDEA